MEIFESCLTPNELKVVPVFFIHLEKFSEKYFLVTRIPVHWNQSHKEQTNANKGCSLKKSIAEIVIKRFLEIGVPWKVHVNKSYFINIEAWKFSTLLQKNSFKRGIPSILIRFLVVSYHFWK